jgi:hypothetical protein
MITDQQAWGTELRQLDTLAASYLCAFAPLREICGKESRQQITVGEQLIPAALTIRELH